MKIKELEQLLYGYSKIPSERKEILLELKDAMKSLNETADGVKALQLSDMPSSHATTDISDMLVKIEERYANVVKRVQNKLDRLEYEEIIIDELMKRLDNKEAQMIKAIYFKGVRRWETIGYETYYSVQHLIREKNRIINKMLTNVN